MVAILIIVVLSMLGAIGFVLYTVVTRSDPQKKNVEMTKTTARAQEFLPFEDIREGMILLGGHKYRAVLECSSTNYALKTEKEKEIIEISFQRFLNSLSFPITFYIQTKMIDNSAMVESLKLDLSNTVEAYPQLMEYAEDYLSKMRNLNAHIGNSIQKKKYIIVPYDEAINLPNLTDEEKFTEAKSELFTRCAMLMDGLAAVGVKAHPLATNELFALVHSSYNKDSIEMSEEIAGGDFMELVVRGEKPKIHEQSDEAAIDYALHEAQQYLLGKIDKETTSDDVRESYLRGIKEIDKLRDSFGAYYKEDVTPTEELTEDVLAAIISNKN